MIRPPTNLERRFPNSRSHLGGLANTKMSAQPPGAQQLVVNFVAAVVAVAAASLFVSRNVSEALTSSCTQVIGYSQTIQWIGAAATTMNNGGIDRVQLLWNNGGAAHLWADPNYIGWSNPVQSPCAQNASAPDRVIMDVTNDAYLTVVPTAIPSVIWSRSFAMWSAPFA